MQHDPDHGDGKFAMSPSTPSPSGSASHIDLKEFPSQMDYTSGLDHDRPAFVGGNNADITSQSSGFGKSLTFGGAGRSRINNLMFPKMRRRPFQCKYCTFSCPSATNLSIHMRIHTGEKPYKCGTCAYASARKQNLFRHMATVHKVDHVTMSGPATATCAYPIGVPSSVEERMPVVENVYGNVQEVVLIDGDPVKIIGRDQGSFSSSDAASSSPHLAQVFPCESAGSASLQEDVVEIMPGSNPTSATEYSTRHYADGSRFIFAGGIAASVTSSAANTGMPQVSPMDQFDTHKEVHVHQVEVMASPEEPQTSKLESPIHPSVYKEPITGALKRKQGRATSHTTLKNILDSPLMFPSKHSSNAAVMPSKSLTSVNHLEKTGSEIKIIQSEEDLEEVLEGRQRASIRVTPSGVCKQQDLTPSPRSLNGCTSVESAAFGYARDCPNDGYYPETRLKGGTRETAAPTTDSIQSSQTSMFRHKHTIAMKPSLARKATEQKATNFQPSSEDVGRVTQAPKRAAPANSSSGRNVTKPVAGSQSQVTLRNYSSLISNASNKDRRPESNSASFEQSTLKKKHHPTMMYDLSSDQQSVQDRPRKESFTACGKASLTVQVDLNKVMCCAARKWLRSHLVECDVCEINLPVEQERFSSCGGRASERGAAGGGCCGESLWDQEHENNRWRRRNVVENHDRGHLGERRLYSCHGRPPQRNEQRSSSAREDLQCSSASASETSQRQQQVVTIDVDDEVCHSDTSRVDDDPIHMMHRRTISGVHPGEPSGVAMSGSKQRSQIGAPRESSKVHGEKRLSSPPNRDQIIHAKTSVVSASCVPISSSHVVSSTPQTVERSARALDQPPESAEYIAFLTAELNRGKAAARKQTQKCVCDICGKVCHSKAQLVSHRRVHIETSQLFRCAVCRYCTLHYKLLKRHIADKHSAVTRTKTYTQCKICSKTVRVTKVTSHMLSVHGLGIQGDDGRPGQGVDASHAEVSGETGREATDGLDDLNQVHVHVAEEEPPQQQDAVAMETDKASPDSREDAGADEDSTPTVGVPIKQEPAQED